MNEKKCSKCRETFPATTEFFHSNGRQGLRTDCKVCVSRRKKEYAERPEVKEARSIYNKLYGKKYREKNKDKIRDKNYKYYKFGGGKERAQQRLKKQPAAIYKIINTRTNKIYIGQTSMVSARFSQHRTTLRRNIHDCKLLQKDYNTYGEEAFVFEVIEELPCDISRDVLLEKESEQIKKYLNEGKKLYNKEGG